MEQKLINKIAKLFALAGNNANKNEAEAAMMKAQELMCANNLDMKDIELKDGKERDVIEMPCQQDTKTVTWWYGQLAGIISKNFRCYAFQDWNCMRTRNSGSHIKFVGHAEDLAIAHIVLMQAVHSLKNCSNYFMTSFKRNNPSLRTKGVKNDYIRGFLTGLQEKFAENVACKDLMIVVPNAVMEVVNKKRLSSSPTRTYTGNSSEANASGQAAGKRFSYGSQNRIG